jgi:hypothetical protein
MSLSEKYPQQNDIAIAIAMCYSRSGWRTADGLAHRLQPRADQPKPAPSQPMEPDQNQTRRPTGDSQDNETNGPSHGSERSRTLDNGQSDVRRCIEDAIRGFA